MGGRTSVVGENRGEKKKNCIRLDLYSKQRRWDEAKKNGNDALVPRSCRGSVRQKKQDKKTKKCFEIPR